MSKKLDEVYSFGKTRKTGERNDVARFHNQPKVSS
jgi:hypothetical protein